MEREATRAVPRDPRLPGLSELVPDTGAPELVASAVGRWLGVDVDPVRGSVAYVGYRPTLSCTVLWSFPGASARPLLVSGRRIRGEGAARVAARSARVEPGTSPGVQLATHGLLLEEFPRDAKLPGLAWAAAPGWGEARLAPTLGLSGEAAQLSGEPVSYRPWQRCVLRYGPHSGVGGRYFGKVFHDRRGEGILCGLQELGRRLRSDDAPWEVPDPVAYLARERMLVTRELAAGRKLNRLLRPARKEREARETLLGHMARAGEGLRFLQRTSSARLRPVTWRDLIDEFRSTTARVSRVETELAKRLSNAFQALERAAARLASEPLVPTHGAFRIDQLLPCDEKLGVLDLDTLCLSGQSADAGNFLAYLDALALRRPKLDAVLAECASAFQGALQSPVAGGPWLSWYRAASLVKVAFRALLRLAPGWPATSEALLGRAHDQLARIG